MRKSILNYPNYTISNDGSIFNSEGIKLKPKEFKNTLYVRLSKNGKRHTVSVNKLLFEVFELVDKHLPLSDDEIGIRYKKSNYYLTNHLRCYNAKTRRFLSPVIRNEYISYSLCIEGKKLVVYPLSFIKNYFDCEV